MSQPRDDREIAVSVDGDDLLTMYSSYLNACNERDWDAVASFVNASVSVNGETLTRAQYVAAIKETIVVFPDYVWQVRHVVLQRPWLSVHLHASGTRQQPFLGAPGDLSPVETDEFAMYRIDDQGIAELWGTADNARLRL